MLVSTDAAYWRLCHDYLKPAFLVYALVMLARRDPFFMRNGFYLLVLWYAVQRLAWEFLKPYAPVLGPLNLFHLICLGLVAYAVVMMRRTLSTPGGDT